MLTLQVQRATRARHLPSDRMLRAWARAALTRDARVTLRYVNAAEGRRLNRDFRAKDYATNVLTFVYAEGRRLSGDIVICAPVVMREAREQGKDLEAHHAHLVVHGLVHLQGMDHEASNAEAQKMEQRERSILRRLGFPDPYAAI
ncbi:MAG: rRNA maturation RNase YbeY [Usitatibacter sp.]